MKSLTPEVRLLLACAGVRPDQAARAEIVELLNGGIDWALFLREAIRHGLAGLVAARLSGLTPDVLPEEMGDAFRVSGEQIRQRNRALSAELAAVTKALAVAGVMALPLERPALATQAEGIGLLIRDRDIQTTVTTLRDLRYERKPALSSAQIELVQRVRGRDMFFKKELGIAAQVHTRLAPIAVDFDCDGLWHRTQRITIDGQLMGSLAPEDTVLVLAISGAHELWWRMDRACDVAHFIRSHPDLDWAAILGRARAQGCQRMVLLATSLARRYFGVALPDGVTAVEGDDRMIEPMLERVIARWLAEETAQPRDDEGMSIERLSLHEGVTRRVRYVVRSLLLPGPYHVAQVRLPARLTSIVPYVPIKIVLDVALRPLARGCRILLGQAGRLRDACASHELALAVMPVSAETRRTLRRHQQARAAARRALAADPTNAGAWYSLGNALVGLKRYKEAVACYDKALDIVPDGAAMWKARHAAIRAGRLSQPVFESDAEPTAAPRDSKAWTRRAGYFLTSQRYAEAAAASDRALAIDPSNLAAMRLGIRCRLATCDWRQRKDDERRITDGVNAGLPIITPFNHRTIRDSEAESLILVRLMAKTLPRPTALWHGEKYRHDRIRVAYLSAEFHEHPMTYVTVGVYEHHDKSRFETMGISLGPNSQGAMRRRIEAAFARFIDASAMTDAEVAALLRDMEVDIAVDLNGYAGSGRPGILAHRPAPAQVNFLAYSGTMGAPFFDYIIGDRMVIPDHNRAHYSEHVVYLPHSYMPTDETRRIAERTPTRIEAGLPETGFVFTCHNSVHKIGPDVFDVWMRLLRAVEGSVLWLSFENPTVNGNLRREARARGVAPERLLFAPRVPAIEDHLARLRLAGLFLDTLPYNAHATACDALWAGLPVLTCTGNTFAGRVAASLLQALGLPELITSSLAEYEGLALALAQTPDRLAALRAKLICNRQTEPLFDTAGYTRHLESAYTMMWERSQRGEPPRSFSVT
jgi:predicted O-linked N-acetylglucosamine transferase (SPINDLY family)